MTHMIQCLLCNKPPEIAYGDILQYNDQKTGQSFHFHYLCLLLAPPLYQKGSDDNGLFGFLGQDAIEEQKRIKNQRCTYCKGPHANLSCCLRKCNRSFHIDCGLENECQYKTDNFVTFCHDHKTFGIQKDINEVHHCEICCEKIQEFQFNKTVFVACCQRNYYHRDCVVQMAYLSGYYFACPLCKDTQKFKEFVMLQSIFIPQRDAAWELEPNAFADHLERPNLCSAFKCLCHKGRSYCESDWKLVVCKGCGSQAIHEKCMEEVKHYFCNICVDIGANTLLKNCSLLSEQSTIQDEPNLGKPCVVKLRDVSMNHMVTKKSKKYFNGKFIRLRYFKESKIEE